MLFNSADFIVFFLLVIVLYRRLSGNFRWILLLAASYIFYMSWKMEYVLLILFSTAIDYYAAIRMEQKSNQKERRPFFLLSLFGNLGMLFLFKYYGFFGHSLNEIFSFLGSSFSLPAPSWLLPVGISFYTFQTLSYSIDVYQGRTKAERHFGYFALYVSFFSQLVAGPIERPGHLLPQLHRMKTPPDEMFGSGIRLMLWGAFKKIVIADRVAMFTGPVFLQPEDFGFFSVVPALFFLLIQIYADFSGYTDIAIGSARCLGIDLSQNFNRPFTATSIRDFWSRWHMTLTNWFRDYVFFNLPVKRKGRPQKWRIQLNLFIMLVLIGLWHGANWTFVAFGALHGIYMVSGNLSRSWRQRMVEKSGLILRPKLHEYLGIARTMFLLMFSAFFFGIHSIGQAWTMMKQAVVIDGFKGSLLWMRGNDSILSVILVIFLFYAERKMARHGGEQIILSKSTWQRWALYLFFVFFILVFGIFHRDEFIYFQF